MDKIVNSYITLCEKFLWKNFGDLKMVKTLVKTYKICIENIISWKKASSQKVWREKISARKNFGGTNPAKLKPTKIFRT